jgi:hypothetical protein
MTGRASSSRSTRDLLVRRPRPARRTATPTRTSGFSNAAADHERRRLHEPGRASCSRRSAHVPESAKGIYLLDRSRSVVSYIGAPVEAVQRADGPPRDGDARPAADRVPHRQRLDAALRLLVRAVVDVHQPRGARDAISGRRRYHYLRTDGRVFARRSARIPTPAVRDPSPFRDRVDPFVGTPAGSATLLEVVTTRHVEQSSPARCVVQPRLQRRLDGSVLARCHRRSSRSDRLDRW